MFRCACCGEKLDNSISDYCYFCLGRKEEVARGLAPILLFGGANLDEEQIHDLIDYFEDCD